jgi:hypothetical protein
MNININREESNINDFLIIFEHLGNRPNRLIIHDSFSGKDFHGILDSIVIKDEKISNQFTELLSKNGNYVINKKSIRQIDEKIWISFLELNKSSENYIVNEICFYYDGEDKIETVNKIVDSLLDYIVDYSDDSIDKVNCLSIVNNALELQSINFSEIEVDGYYNITTTKQIDKLVKSIKKNKKGLSILHGERGLGKTNAVKYISSKVDRMSIYIPINLIEQSINNPEFINFIKKYESCLLIVDDCEFLYSFGKNNFFSSNIIQLIDGFFSDELNLQIILLFNSCKEEIDNCLLDSNNIIDVIEFDLLDSKTATDLSESIGKDRKFKDDVKLIEVLNNKKKTKKEGIGLK